MALMICTFQLWEFLPQYGIRLLYQITAYDFFHAPLLTSDLVL